MGGFNSTKKAQSINIERWQKISTAKVQECGFKRFFANQYLRSVLSIELIFQNALVLV